MKNLLLILSSGLLFFYSCAQNKGTSTGNPVVSVSMTGASQSAVADYKNNKFLWMLNQAYAFTPPASLLDRSGLTVNLTDFWVNISEIEFKTEETALSGEVDGTDVQFTGPYLVNLFSNSPQKFVSGSIVNNNIRRIKYKTKKITDTAGGNPAGMVNYSLYLTGRVNGNNFTLISGQELVYETAGPNLVTFSNNDNVLLEVLSADLIRKINLSQVTNNVVISESNRLNTASACPDIDASASDVYTCFIKAFQKQTKLGKDQNGNFDLETGEDSVN